MMAKKASVRHCVAHAPFYTYVRIIKSLRGCMRMLTQGICAQLLTAIQLKHKVCIRVCAFINCAKANCSLRSCDVSANKIKTSRGPTLISLSFDLLTREDLMMETRRVKGDDILIKKIWVSHANHQLKICLLKIWQSDALGKIDAARAPHR